MKAVQIRRCPATVMRPEVDKPGLPLSLVAGSLRGKGAGLHRSTVRPPVPLVAGGLLRAPALPEGPECAATTTLDGKEARMLPRRVPALILALALLLRRVAPRTARQRCRARQHGWRLSPDHHRRRRPLGHPGERPQRIISLAASNTELLYAIGLQDKLVGVDDYSDYPAEAKNKEKVGGFSKPNVEKIVSLAPDLVLGHEPPHQERGGRPGEPRSHGRSSSSPPLWTRCRRICACWGNWPASPTRLRRWPDEIDQRIDAVTEQAPRPRRASRASSSRSSPDLITLAPARFWTT